MSKHSEFSLDELRVKEEEIRPPTIFPLSIFVCETEFVQQVDDVANLKRQIKKRLIDMYSFKKRGGRRFKEGFLDFNGLEDTIECFFARETPIKINYERDDLKIHEDRIRQISPNFGVKIKISLNNKSAKVVLFGGMDTIIRKALDEINYCIRACITGGHRTFIPGFSRKDMATILQNFGLNVEYIWIDPGESEKFMKMIEKRVKGEIKREPEYIVHAKLRGYRITGSPIVLELIEESGIYLREIQGRLGFPLRTYITARVSSAGKVLFYIPEALVPKEATIYDIAEKLYEKIISQRAGPKQTTMGEFVVEES